MSNAQTVMFAIHASLRLYGATRKAYTDSVRGKPLILPLPRTPGVQVDSALNWFRMSSLGRRVRGSVPRVDWLVSKNPRTKPERAELVDLYQSYWSREHPQNKKSSGVLGQPNDEELRAMLELRQWSESEADEMRTPLQTMAGTLVNVAVDYFVQTPGAVSETRPTGRALKAFLSAMDETDFAEVPPDEIATGLMVAVLDAVSGNPDLFGGSDSVQRLIGGLSGALAGSATELLEDATDKQRRTAAVWLERIGYSVLKGAAETVLAEPGRFLNVKPGAESEVVVEVGTTLTHLLLGEREVVFRRLFSAGGLEKVARSALVAVAKNPAVLRIDNKGLENLLVAVAEELSSVEESLSSSMFPELARLLIDRTADNLELIWGDSGDPQRHLLIVATGSLLKSLAKEPAEEARWKPRFTPEQILIVAETVLDEVVDNPGWVIDEAGEVDSRLGIAIEAMLAALRKVPGNRLSSETGVAVLQAGIQAVALRLSFLADLPPTGVEPAKVAITAALDAVFDEIFADGAGAEANWDLARNSSLQMLVEIVLDALARMGVGPTEIRIVREAIRSLVAGTEVFDPEAFAELLQEQLEAA